MTHAEFWNRTPLDAWEAIEAAAWHKRQRERFAIFQSWHVAAFVGSMFGRNGLKPLEHYLPDDGEDSQTDAVELSPEMEEELIWKMLVKATPVQES